MAVQLLAGCARLPEVEGGVLEAAEGSQVLGGTVLAESFNLSSGRAWLIHGKMGHSRELLVVRQVGSWFLSSVYGQTWLDDTMRRA